MGEEEKEKECATAEVSEEPVAKRARLEATIKGEEKDGGVHVIDRYAYQWKQLTQSAARMAATYNRNLLYGRVHTRGLYYDAYSQLVHLPSSQVLKLSPTKTRVGNYPVRLIPNQYVDGYLIYSEQAMRNAYDPNYVEEVGPPPGQTQIPLQGGSNSMGTRREEKSRLLPNREGGRSKQSLAENQTPEEKRGRKPKPTCYICAGTDQKNKEGEPEAFVQCSTCKNSVHPSCVELPPDLVKVIATYDWQCVDCKKCIVCNDQGSENKFLFCDECDRGFHTFCIGMKSIPAGRFVCKMCGQCASCDRNNPGDGPNSKWRHEYSKPKADGSQGRFLQTLCTGCSKQFRVGNFCPVCLKVYRATENDLPMVCCDQCDRWIHIGCDNIDEDTYEQMAHSSQQYICCLCRGEVEEQM